MEGYISFQNEITEKDFYQNITPFLQEGYIHGDKISLHFVDFDTDRGEDDQDVKHDGEENVVSIYSKKHSENLKGAHFQHDRFFENLSTDLLGHVLIFLKCVTSTMDVGHLLHKHAPKGLIIVAEKQRSGRGRGGTTWESPAGCAMFTFSVVYEDESELGRKPAFLGYISSCAVVKSVQQLTEGSIDVHLKWPNDIYGGPNKDQKISGTLHDLVPGGTVIGVGVNVSNSNPTISLNNLITNLNENLKKKLSKISIDQLIAAFMNNFEELFRNVQNGSCDALINQFTKSWIHKNITYSNQIDAHIEPYNVIFKGLDDKGFLLIEKVIDQSEESISPHGMSVDVVNHILMKKPHLQ